MQLDDQQKASIERGRKIVLSACVVITVAYAAIGFVVVKYAVAYALEAVCS